MLSQLFAIKPSMTPWFTPADISWFISLARRVCSLLTVVESFKRFWGVWLCAVPFESKLTPDSQSLRRELRIESRTQFSIVESRFQIFNSCETHQTGTFLLSWKKLALYSWYPIAARTYSLIQVLSNRVTSLKLEKTFYSIK